MSVRHEPTTKATDRSARSMAMRAYRGIKEDILTGRYRPGEMVLAQQLAESYRMSRTPVREALKTLANDGLIEVIPRVGHVISTVTVNDVHEILQLRLVLETTAIELAAARVTNEDIERVRRFAWAEGARHARHGRLTPASLARASAAHRDFHIMVASLSGSRRLTGLVVQFLDESQRILALDPMNLQQLDLMSAASHGGIVRALAARDRRRAIDAVTEHIRSAQDRITNALLPELGPRGSALNGSGPDGPAPRRGGRTKRS